MMSTGSHITAKILEFEVCLKNIHENCTSSQVTFLQIQPLIKYLIELRKSRIPKDDMAKFVQCLVSYITIVMEYNNLTPGRTIQQHIETIRNCFEPVPAVLEAVELKNTFLLNATEELFNVFLLETHDFWCKRQLLKTYINCIQESDLVARVEIAEKQQNELYGLIDALEVSGDFDTQSRIIEIIFLVYFNHIGSNKDIRFIQVHPNLYKFFTCSLKTDTYYVDVRNFLNEYNREKDTFSSLPCKYVRFGKSFKCEPPAGLDVVWVDFNLQPKTVTWYCKKTSLMDNPTNDNSKATGIFITLFESSVKSVEINRTENEMILEILYNESCLSNKPETQIFFDKAKRKLSLFVKNEYRDSKLISYVLPCMFGIKFKHTASMKGRKTKAVYRPLRLSRKSLSLSNISNGENRRSNSAENSVKAKSEEIEDDESNPGICKSATSLRFGANEASMANSEISSLSQDTIADYQSFCFTTEEFLETQKTLNEMSSKSLKQPITIRRETLDSESSPVKKTAITVNHESIINKNVLKVNLEQYITTKKGALVSESATPKQNTKIISDNESSYSQPMNEKVCKSPKQYIRIRRAALSSESSTESGLTDHQRLIPTQKSNKSILKNTEHTIARSFDTESSTQSQILLQKPICIASSEKNNKEEPGRTNLADYLDSENSVPVSQKQLFVKDVKNVDQLELGQRQELTDNVPDIHLEEFNIAKENVESTVTDQLLVTKTVEGDVFDRVTCNVSSLEFVQITNEQVQERFTKEESPKDLRAYVSCVKNISQKLLERKDTLVETDNCLRKEPRKKVTSQKQALLREDISAGKVEQDTVLETTAISKGSSRRRRKLYDPRDLTYLENIEELDLESHDPIRGLEEVVGTSMEARNVIQEFVANETGDKENTTGNFRKVRKNTTKRSKKRQLTTTSEEPIKLYVPKKQSFKKKLPVADKTRQAVGPRFTYKESKNNIYFYTKNVETGGRILNKVPKGCIPFDIDNVLEDLRSEMRGITSPERDNNNIEKDRQQNKRRKLSYQEKIQEETTKPEISKKYSLRQRIRMKDLIPRGSETVNIDEVFESTDMEFLEERMLTKSIPKTPPLERKLYLLSNKENLPLVKNITPKNTPRLTTNTDSPLPDLEVEIESAEYRRKNPKTPEDYIKLPIEISRREQPVIKVLSNILLKPAQAINNYQPHELKEQSINNALKEQRINNYSREDIERWIETGTIF